MASARYGQIKSKKAISMVSNSDLVKLAEQKNRPKDAQKARAEMRKRKIS